MRPLISVLIPAYNVEEYIEEAVASILNQTYTNLEIIIIDDCSADSTGYICSKLIHKDNRIKFYKNDKNSGIAVTLNRALKLSTGEYILRMDADDISQDNRIEVLFEYLVNNKVDIVGSSTITIDSNGNEIGRYYPLKNHLDIINTLKYATPLLHIWLCKKNLYEKVGDYRYPPVEDYDFLLRCVKYGAKLANVPECLYKVRLRDGNTVDLYGYKQLKAFESAYRAFAFNEPLQELDNNSIVSKAQQYLYILSRSILMKGSYNVKRGNKILAGVFFITSGLVSIYQFRYLNRRLSLYLYKKKNKL